MKVLLVLALIAIIYGWYLSKNKSFINKCKEEHKNRSNKGTEHHHERNAKETENKKTKRTRNNSN